MQGERRDRVSARLLALCELVASTKTRTHGRPSLSVFRTLTSSLAPPRLPTPPHPFPRERRDQRDIPLRRTSRGKLAAEAATMVYVGGGAGAVAAELDLVVAVAERASRWRRGGDVEVEMGGPLREPALVGPRKAGRVPVPRRASSSPPHGTSRARKRWWILSPAEKCLLFFFASDPLRTTWPVEEASRPHAADTVGAAAPTRRRRQSPTAQPPLSHPPCSSSHRSRAPTGTRTPTCRPSSLAPAPRTTTTARPAPPLLPLPAASGSTAGPRSGGGNAATPGSSRVVIPPTS